MYFVYSLLTLGVFAVASPYFVYQAVRYKKYIGSLRQRLGYLPITFNIDGDESIWIHAVSVGEALTVREDDLDFADVHRVVGMQANRCESAVLLTDFVALAIAGRLSSGEEMKAEINASVRRYGSRFLDVDCASGSSHCNERDQQGSAKNHNPSLMFILSVPPRAHNESALLRRRA